jgi:cytochrome c oxidase subunit 3
MSASSHVAAGPARVVPASLGMWIFIGSEVLFFGGLMAAYLHGRMDWPHGFGLASRQTHVVLGTLNTAVLLTSSALVALAVACAGHPRKREWTARLLWATAALGLVFLCVKGWEYRQEWTEGLFPGPGFALAAPGAQLFFMLYWVMTGVHAVHLLCGMAAVAVFARATARRREWVTPDRVECLALYWHFVDIVWIFLYPFLYLVERHA